MRRASVTSDTHYNLLQRALPDCVTVKQESRAIERKPRDAACYLFRYLKYKLYTISISISSQLLHSRLNPLVHIIFHLKILDDPLRADSRFIAIR